MYMKLLLEVNYALHKGHLSLPGELSIFIRLVHCLHKICFLWHDNIVVFDSSHVSKHIGHDFGELSLFGELTLFRLTLFPLKDD